MSETVIIENKPAVVKQEDKQISYPKLDDNDDYVKSVQKQEEKIKQKIQELEKASGIEAALQNRVPLDSKDPFKQLFSLNYVMVTGILYFIFNFILLILG